jgi:hypothetical protein
MFWGSKKEVALLPKDNMEEACKILEGLVKEEIEKQQIDLTQLDANCDLNHHRKNDIYSRYIRARAFKIEECKNMLINSLKWRINVKPNTVTVDDVLEILKRDYVFFHEVDKESNPIVWVNVQYHIEFQNKLPEYQKFVYFMMEEGIRRVNKILDNLEAQQAEDQKEGREVKPLPELRATLIFDMRGFAMANMDFAIVKFLAETLQAYYPEVLAHTYIVDAPWIFQTCWTMIKGWLDPVVVSKIEFINRDYLLKVLDVEKVPIKNGGTCEHPKMWEHRN